MSQRVSDERLAQTIEAAEEYHAAGRADSFFIECEYGRNLMLDLRDARAETARLRDELRLADDLLLRLAAMTAHAERLREALEDAKEFAVRMYGGIAPRENIEDPPPLQAGEIVAECERAIAATPAASLAAAQDDRRRLVESAVRAGFDSADMENPQRIATIAALVLAEYERGR